MCLFVSKSKGFVAVCPCSYMFCVGFNSTVNIHRRSGTVRIRLSNPTWRSTSAVRARRKYPIPWSTWRQTARDSRDVVVRRHQPQPLPTAASLLPRRITSSLSTSPNSVTSRIMRFRLPSLRQMVSHVLRAVTRGSAAVARESSAFTRGSSAVARETSAVTRKSSAQTRGPQAIARTSSAVAGGSSAITRGFPAASEGSGPAARSASGSEVGTEALPAALSLGGFASAAGSASTVKSVFGVPSDDPYYAILTTLTEPFPALPPSVRALLRRRALAVAAARASVAAEAAAGQSRTGAALTRPAAGASSLGKTAAGSPGLGQAATAASSLTQTASGAQSLTRTTSGAQSVGQTASGTSRRQIPRQHCCRRRSRNPGRIVQRRAKDYAECSQPGSKPCQPRLRCAGGCGAGRQPSRSTGSGAGSACVHRITGTSRLQAEWAGRGGWRELPGLNRSGQAKTLRRLKLYHQLMIPRH